MNRTICQSSGQRGPQGPQGDSGVEIDRANFPVLGKLGLSGTISMKSTEYKSISSKISSAWLGMLLHYCELNYLNQKLDKVSSTLIFLHNILREVTFITDGSVDNIPDTIPDTIPRGVPERIPPMVLLIIDGNLKDEIENYRNRIKLLMVQLSQGLDYFGYYPNYVPLVSISTYKSFLEQLLRIGENIESSYNNFFLQGQNEKVKRNSILIAIEELNSKSVALANQEKQLISELEEARDHIQTLLIQQIQLFDQVNRAGENFKRAVSDKAACGFEDVLNASMAIVSIATGAGAVTGSLAAISLISEKVKEGKIKNSIEGKAKYLVEELKTIKGGLSEIKNGYIEIRNLLDNNADSAKLLLDEENFEETIKKFQNLEEAQEYGKLMKAFLTVVKVRNSEILYADAILSRLNEMNTERDLLKTEILNTQSRLIETTNPVTSSNVVFFERAILRIKADILRVINMEFKALKYWSLNSNDIPIQYEDSTISHLNTMHATFLTSYLSLIEERNTAPQSFEGPVEIVFKRDEIPEVFETFDRTNQLVFDVNPMLPQYQKLCWILVKSVQLRISDLSFQNGEIYSCVLTHHGNPKFTNFYGESVEYIHSRRRSFAYFRNEKSIFGLGYDLEGTYSYLSPFATWSIEIAGITDGQQINTKIINELGLTFTGVAYARYSEQ